MSTLTNCTFFGNSASDLGGAIFNNYSSSFLINCILWSNSAPTDDQIHLGANSSTTNTYSDIQQTSGVYTGTGNINANPLFVRNPSPGADGAWGTFDDDYGDLRLQVGSLCIDVGSNAAVPASVTTDLAGNPRIFDYPGVGGGGAVVDMGAYEREVPVTVNGSGGNDPLYLRLSPDGSQLQVWRNLTGIGSPDSVYAIHSLDSCIISAGDGNDTMIVDFSNGPVLPGLFTFDGAAGNDTLILAGLSAGQRVLVQSGQVAVDGVTIVLTNIESVTIDAPANSAVSLGALNLSSKLSLLAGKNLVLKTAGLSISGAGLLDLADNDLIVPNGNLTQITGWLTQGQATLPATRWQGTTGIISSEAAKPENANQTLAVGKPGSVVFHGQTLDSNCVAVKYTVNGDADLSGSVDGDDYFFIDRGFLKGSTGYQNGDFNYSDTAIDGDDYFLIDAAFMARSMVVAREPVTSVVVQSPLSPIAATPKTKAAERAPATELSDKPSPTGSPRQSAANTSLALSFTGWFVDKRVFATAGSMGPVAKCDLLVSDRPILA